MLLVLLMISTGCDVNIPGCGKRSLPFFKQIVPPASTSTPAPVVVPSVNSPAIGTPTPASPQANVAVKKNAKAQPIEFDNSQEMSISKPSPTLSPTPTATATPVDIEKIAYTTYEDGVSSLRIMNPDGTDVIHVTPRGVGAWYPTWSPNGKLLAFLSLDKDGKINLFVLKKGDSNYQQLTQFDDWVLGKADILKPPLTWSPLSDEMAFIYHNQIWKVNLKSQDLITLFTSDPDLIIVRQEWAPHRDNKYIAFLYSQGLNYSSLYFVNPRQKDFLDLVDSDHALLDLSWSPDALKVAYSVKPDSIYTASSNTSRPVRLIYGASPDLGPLLRYSSVESGSPMLLMLAKKSMDDDGYRVALMDQPAKNDQDSGTLKFLTGPGVTNAIWSPDGSKIGYIINGNFWIMDNSGNNKKLISPDGVVNPDWSKK